MTLQGWLQIVVFFAIIVAITPLLGSYMARVYTGKRVALARAMGPIERGIYRSIRVDPQREQDWKSYAASLLLFSLAGWLLLYLILRTQSLHPFNPEGFHSMPWNVTFNTVTSFLTNTNWQYYGGETTLTYFSQMAGLTVQNFASAAVGICVAVALIRGIVGRSGTIVLDRYAHALGRHLQRDSNVLGARAGRGALHDFLREPINMVTAFDR